MSKRSADAMDVDIPDIGKRARKLTEKGAEYAAKLQAKKNTTLAKIEVRQSNARSQPEVDELADLFNKVKVADTDDDIDALASQLARMGGRRKTRKSKKTKKSRKTRKH